MAGERLPELARSCVPDVDHPCLVAGSDGSIVGAEGDTPGLACATGEAVADLARCHVPDPRGAVVPGCCQPMAVMAEGDAMDPARLTLQPPYIPVGRPIPEDDRALISGQIIPESLSRGHAGPVGAEGDRCEGRRVRTQDGYLLARRDVPDADRTIEAGRRQMAAIRAKGHVMDDPLVPLQHAV